MSNTTTLKHTGLVAGPQTKLCWVKFTPNGTSAPTVEESHGCSSVVSYDGVGVYTVTVSSAAMKAMAVTVDGLQGDANYHEWKKAESVANKTVTISHRTCSYATIVSAGPAASNVSGQITVTILSREAS